MTINKFFLTIFFKIIIITGFREGVSPRPEAVEAAVVVPLPGVETSSLALARVVAVELVVPVRGRPSARHGLAHVAGSVVAGILGGRS